MPGLYAKSVEAQIKNLSNKLPQGLLLYGEDGVGLRDLGLTLAGQHAEQVKPDESKASPTISIDSIRTLYVNTRGKRDRQVILINEANLMSIPAQHAFLKLLEEPQAHVHFILTSHQPERLLPTIHSRLQKIHVPRVEADRFATWLDGQTSDERVRQQIMFVAAGRPALARRLLNNTKELDDFASTMRDARDFVGSDRYKACEVALSYAKTPASARLLIDASIMILRHTLSKQPQTDVIERLERLADIDDKLAINASARLQLLRFVVQ